MFDEQTQKIIDKATSIKEYAKQLEISNVELLTKYKNILIAHSKVIDDSIENMELLNNRTTILNDALKWIKESGHRPMCGSTVSQSERPQDDCTCGLTDLIKNTNLQ